MSNNYLLKTSILLIFVIFLSESNAKSVNSKKIISSRNSDFISSSSSSSASSESEINRLRDEIVKNIKFSRRYHNAFKDACIPIFFIIPWCPGFGIYPTTTTSKPFKYNFGLGKWKINKMKFEAYSTLFLVLIFCTFSKII